MKKIFLAVFIVTLSVTGFSQNNQVPNIDNRSDDSTYSYAYILVRGGLFTKKLKVDVDLGDTPEQIKEGKEYSEKLTNRKSFAAILNYMVERKFELVETLEYTEQVMGSGGTSGIVFIMKKK